MKIHEKYMSRCIQLAKNGLGTTYPNPLVGSVIVYNNTIIGEGWHNQAGLPHAEVNAINNVIDETQLKEATLYVNLEPCSHFGKTPPCSDLIVSKGIKKVVIGCKDPNTKVAGKGIQKLKEAGCEVIENVLQNEAMELNKRFFTFQNKKRPYIFLKWAQTNDGFMAPKNKQEVKPVWISNEFSRQWVHKMRTQEQAILVGTQTVLDDNPLLNARDWKGNSPIRVVLDKTLKIPNTAAIYDQSIKTLILTESNNYKKNLPSKGEKHRCLLFEKIDFSENIASQICELLYTHAIQSVIVEGGSKTLQTFIDENLWDEAFVFEGPMSFLEGTKAPLLKAKIFLETTLKSDRLLHYKNKNT
ncbi:MAG: bifunctional diaminohydroxyphosphoribosylaminopyrimidine deaminase/5-amino-6-(5-phosphoribosylamino)uracil reductase RibD [Flavobacteriaceae bacterium]